MMSWKTAKTLLGRSIVAATAASLAAAAAPALGKSRCEKLECDEIKQEIREIQSRMRSGYTHAQGERYEARLRKLKTRRRRVCR